MDEYKSSDEVVTERRPDIPVTCFRPEMLDTAARWFLNNFNGKTLYAVKVNPAPYVVSRLHAAGITAFDAASVAEVRTVSELCPGSFIAFMHPVKSRSAIEQSYFDFGVRDFAFDCKDELEKILASTGQSKDLSLVLRMALPSAESGLFMGGKFGAQPENMPDLLKAARKVARRVGIAFHVGGQTMDPAAYTTALETVGAVLRTMPRTKVDVIDIGGGFPSIYPDMTPPPLSQYKLAIERGIDALPHADQYEYWAEPGRALVAESASILVRVDLRKDDTLYINDGTFGSLFDANPALGFRFPVRHIPAKKGTTKAALKPFRFFGPTCTSEDYMPGPFYLPENIKQGDYIEIGQLGAYGNTMRTGFNGFSEHDIVSVKSKPLMSMYEDVTAKKLVTA